MDNFFSSLSLFLELHKEFKTNSCGTIRSNRKNYPKNLASKEMAEGECIKKYWNGMTALIWKDKREVNMLSNMHHPNEVLNALIIYKMRNENMTHKLFRQNLIKQLIQSAENHLSSKNLTSSLKSHDSSKAFNLTSNYHWPVQKNNQRRCAVCSIK